METRKKQWLVLRDMANWGVSLRCYRFATLLAVWHGAWKSAVQRRLSMQSERTSWTKWHWSAVLVWINTHWHIRWLQAGTLPRASCESLAQWRNEISETTVNRWRWRCQKLPQSHWTEHRVCTMICRLEPSLQGRRLSTRPRSCPNAKLALHSSLSIV